MAKKQKTVVEVDYKVKGASNVENSFDGVAESANEAATAVENVNTNTKKSKGAFAAAKEGVGGLITGFKAVIANPVGATIAAVVGAVQLLSSVFESNEDASNKMGQGFAFLKGLLTPLKDVFFDVFDFIVGAIEKPGEAFDMMLDLIETGFNAWKTFYIDPFIGILEGIFFGIEKGIIKLQLAWADFTGDDEGADKLNARLEEVNQNLDEAADKVTGGYRMVANAVIDAVEGTAEFAQKMAEAAERAAELEKREQDLIKTRRKQEVQNDKNLAQLEEFKLIRDDEAKSFADRIEANNKIAKVEKERVESAKKLLNDELKLLQDKSVELGKGTEILQLIADKEKEIAELRAETAGIEVEQVTNANALKRDQLDLEVQRIDRQFELNTALIEDEQRVADMRIEAEEKKLSALREIGVTEKGIIEEQLFQIQLARTNAEVVRRDKAREAEEQRLADLEAKKVIEDKRIADELKAEQKLAEEKAKIAEEAEKKKAEAEENARKEKAKKDKEAADLEIQIKQELNNQILNFSNSLVTALGNDSKEGLAIQKAVTLAQIAVDTAKAISSLTAASAANPLNGPTFGAAGIAQFASGILQIGANMTQAYALLKQPAPQLDPGDDGASAPPPSTDETRPDNGFDGISAGSERFGSQIIRAYVTESDITQSQESASNIQNLSQLG